MKTLVFAFLCTLFVASENDSKHEYHVTLSEVALKEKALEIAIRAHTSDLEAVINLNKTKKIFAVPADSGSAWSNELKAYVESSIWAKSEKEMAQIVWIGYEYGLDESWLYVKAVFKKKPKSIDLGNSMFFELFDDQKNIVNFTHEAAQKQHLITKQNALAKLL